ncbi:protein mago nashi [Rhodotorula toruloides]|nr:protein mago nashi [Rhodotorula toruloides]
MDEGKRDEDKVRRSETPRLGWTAQEQARTLHRTPTDTLDHPPAFPRLAVAFPPLISSPHLPSPFTSPTRQIPPHTMSTDPFYMRYYSGHVGSYGHEFIEFEISGNRLRFALNTNYRNEGLLRREMYLSEATLKEFQRIVAESEITKEDDSKWPQKSVIGKQEFECRMAPYHLAFQTAKIGSLVDVQNSDDPEGLRVFYYLVQDLKIFVYSLISLHFHIKPTY